MSNIAPLLDRNRAFASDPGARQGMPRLPFIPNLNLYIVTCIDCRVDPAQILGVKLGEALVQRNIGGRITPAVITDIAYAGYLVDTKAPEGPYFEVAIIHHTDCGSTLLADDELRHGFAQRIGTDERTLADTPVLDPARTVPTDVERVLWAEESRRMSTSPGTSRRRHRPGDHHRRRESQEVGRRVRASARPQPVRCPRSCGRSKPCRRGTSSSGACSSRPACRSR